MSTFTLQGKYWMLEENYTKLLSDHKALRLFMLHRWNCPECDSGLVDNYYCFCCDKSFQEEVDNAT